jgi:hypothetical protein
MGFRPKQSDLRRPSEDRSSEGRSRPPRHNGVMKQSIGFLVLIAGLVIGCGTPFEAGHSARADLIEQSNAGTGGGHDGAGGSGGRVDPSSSVSSGSGGQGGAASSAESSSAVTTGGGSCNLPQRCKDAGVQCGTVTVDPAKCGGQMSMDCGVCPEGDTCGDNGHVQQCGHACASLYAAQCQAAGAPFVGGGYSGFCTLLPKDQCSWTVIDMSTAFWCCP